VPFKKKHYHYWGILSKKSTLFESPTSIEISVGQVV